LAKIDKSQFTKEEWHRIKEQRRLEKAQKSVDPVAISPQETVDNKYYVLCLKHGTKYSSDYVNRLYNMIKRNCTLNYEFVCMTEDTAGLNGNIKTIPLPLGLSGWWYKPYMFSNDLPIKGIILYIDLDVVIASNIDKLFTYQPNNWCTIRDFTRVMRANWKKYNSSVVRFKTGQLSHVWENFNKDKVNIQRRLFGDQDWLYEATRDRQAILYPDSWILSWKWEVRKTKEFRPGGQKGNRKLKTIEHVTPRIECCMTVFHGDPQPHNCEDPWVVDNWK
jgi:hypothetical protein